MKLANTTLLATALIAALAVPAAARDGSSSLRDFNKESAKARAEGGYGNPLIAVPAAIADAMTEMVTGDKTEDTKAVTQGADAPKN